MAFDGNLIVQGDNLKALKALMPIYAGRVDCIFIDPPYNTGNEGWAYNDNVNAPMIKEWLAANPIGIDDGLRHDKWCAMMWPRSRILFELLSEGGSLWMTLDDNEAHRAKILLDELFGEENFIANVVWQKNTRHKMMPNGLALITIIYWWSQKNVIVGTPINWKEVRKQMRATKIQTMIRAVSGNPAMH